MPRHNEDLAQAFDEMADLLSLRDANPFRVRAYRRAAQVVRAQPDGFAAMLGRGFDPDALPGIGADLAGKIREFLAHGEFADLAKLRREVPPGLRELLALRGLGPARVQLLHRRLRVRDLGSLRSALDEGRVARIQGLGPALQASLREQLRSRAAEGRRTLRAAAEPYALALADHLGKLPGVSRAAIAGSFRRGRDTVGDLDMVVAASPAFALGPALRAWDETRSIEAEGATRASIVLAGGLRVDVRAVARAEFGAALLYFTGSKAHNLRLRQLARDQGLKLNEYGLFRGDARIAGATERSIYDALGLQVPPPELREDRGEIEAARERRIPRLLAGEDLRGDLHVHSDASDGHATVAELRDAAAGRGLEYLAITDHVGRAAVMRSLSAAALRRHVQAIRRIDARGPGPRLLAGAEVDILEDGTLALDDGTLALLDLVVVAVHDHFGLPRERQTERLLRAVGHPCVHLLAHPTGRLIGERPPVDADWPRGFDAAAGRGVWLEINAQPSRLDLDDVLARDAAARGVALAIGSDAHGTEGVGLLRHGVVQARRAWLRRRDVANAWPLATLMKRRRR